MDFWTLYVVGTVVLAATALFVVLATRVYDGELRRSGRVWAVAVLLSAVGYLAVGLRSQIPQTLSILTGHATGVAACCAYWHATSIFAGRPIRWLRIYAPVPLAVVSAAWFTLGSSHLSLRVAVFSLLCALPLALSAIALRQRRDRPSTSSSRLASLVFAAFAALFVVRAAIRLPQNPTLSTQSNFAVSPSEQVMILLILVGFSTLSFLFLVLANARLTGDLERLAMLDSLTERFNRRAIEGLGARALEQARRHGRPLAVALVDIDHFKTINDEAGHAAGDAALVAVAQLLTRSLRADDAIGRAGGDEFLLVMPDTDVAEAIVVCDRLRLAARDLEYADRATAGPRLTLSVGVAEATPERPTLEALVRAADQALYEAKRRGRDRVEVASSSTVALASS